MTARGRPFEAHIKQMPSGCWEWQGYRTQKGYGRYRRELAHRLAYQRANGPIPSGLFVCHSCDNPACVNPAHLWVGTHTDNMRDMIAKGRWRGSHWNGQRRGEGNPRAKLTVAQVKEIRSLRGVVSQNELARRFGVRQGLISGIMNGHLWKDFPA